MDDMNGHNEQVICRRASYLLVGLADHAEEAGLEDLAVYLMTARAELVLGPWQVPLVEEGPEDRVSLTLGISTVLQLLDRLREGTDEVDAIVAIAMARLWVVDGVRWLDGEAKRVAEASHESTVDKWWK